MSVSDTPFRFWGLLFNDREDTAPLTWRNPSFKTNIKLCVYLHEAVLSWSRQEDSSVGVDTRHPGLKNQVSWQPGPPIGYPAGWPPVSFWALTICGLFVDYHFTLTRPVTLSPVFQPLCSSPYDSPFNPDLNLPLPLLLRWTPSFSVFPLFPFSFKKRKI